MMFCCLRNCLNGGLSAPSVSLHNKNNEIIQLDTQHMGHEVVIIKDGTRVCGSGGCLATAPLVQSKSYFEVKLQQAGHWSVGLATRQADLNRAFGGQDTESWCLGSDNVVRTADRELHKLEELSANEEGAVGGDIGKDTDLLIQQIKTTKLPAEGDTIGIAFDHDQLNFYLNGVNLEVPIFNVRGTVYPALFVDDGAILDIVLDNFRYNSPAGYDPIMLEKSIL